MFSKDIKLEYYSLLSSLAHSGKARKGCYGLNTVHLEDRLKNVCGGRLIIPDVNKKWCHSGGQASWVKMTSHGAN